MKKNVLKTLVVLLIVMVTFSNISVFAANLTDVYNGSSNKVGGAVNATQKLIGTILNVIRIVGMAIAIIILTFIGIKFMIASPSEKANIKQYLMNYVIGLFILIGGVAILTIIRDFALTI